MTEHQDIIRHGLSYHPPYDWGMMMDFYKMRLIPGVEMITDNKDYRRTIRIVKKLENYSGWIEIAPVQGAPQVMVTMSGSLKGVEMEVLERVRVAFDLDLRPERLPEILPRGIRLPGCFDAFEMATRAILGQQITVRAALTLTARVVGLLGSHADTPWDELTHYFPQAKSISSITDPITEVLGPLGVIKTRSHSIQALATAIASGEIVLQRGVDPLLVYNQLLSLKGIGPWTAQYLTMRGTSWPDAFPVTDIGIRHALEPLLRDHEGKLLFADENAGVSGLSKYKINKLYEASALAYADAFRPWRSYLTIALWSTL
ncbi:MULTISPECIES: DNA-3-methyladenine glycosylase [unclassified Fusibacter]|uniref:DNA-3-methyladenine glycosylase family protein n=1 Tax=unclassified Fusibacter TaxID=2624464 RepID=UPI0010128EF9|nr:MULTISPECIES: AlkA N-terminal domain-containing protein [unclassified Fusibacter]MCK8058865.1 DNA-3-methyladenine glycosylase [Fusibacter sp. A2]NPE21940.1 DNA-3-methyladenine glycosylase 2 family protein [Fusibacter sp. A1]RXV61508.1 DNA-3-methyladenine glycosylase 2 family protein [Fusibacter sp. A1]